MFRRIVSGVTAGVAVCAALSFVDGCLTRPVEAGKPITRTNFTTSVQTSTIDKVDLLFDIDNSASMGDKQAFLAKAIPDLVTRLLTPNCVDTNMKVTGPSRLDGSCMDPSSTAEFPPVHNLHIGVLSSSLGARLGDKCPSTGIDSMQSLTGGGTIDRHNDDQAHLLDRSADPNNLSNYSESPLGAADPNHFLDWFPPPSVSPNNQSVMEAPPPATAPPPVTDPGMLQSYFQSLVVGVHQFGCGIESQLETWYRFLIQPDPYGDLKTTVMGDKAIAQWDGVDTTILQQRADFLRPDSLVAILVLSDENDSEVDVRSFGGSGYYFMQHDFNPPRGTQICLTNPNDPGCTSCLFGSHANDPECMKGDHTVPHDWGKDLNLRHVHEKEKYGVSVQFPIRRYLQGLTSPKVPNRDGEYPPDGHGGYADSYQGLDPANHNCTNPLFAKTLPRAPGGDVANWHPQWTSNMPPADPNNDLCNLPIGNRQPSLIFYAHIGGVPHELLQVDPGKSDLASQSQKQTLSAADWQLILGKDPENYDYTGIDPHMIESYKPRTGAAVPVGGHTLAPETTTAANPDPINGREWITDSTDLTVAPHQLAVDREYACIFKLPDGVRHCDANALGSDPTLADSCDCADTESLPHAQVPAVCDGVKPTDQVYAKAYPTIRELLLAKLMGEQGIISSLCPIHTVPMSTNGVPDPLYGYRPAMNAIIAKLSVQLGDTCLPQRLTIQPPDPVTHLQTVQCLVLGTFPSAPDAPKTCAGVPGGGWSNPDPEILDHFRKDQHAAWLASGNPSTTDPMTELTCALQQFAANVDCHSSSRTGPMGSAGWCYLDTSSATKTCAQAIHFTPNAQPSGVVTSLQCLEQQPSFGDGGT